MNRLFDTDKGFSSECVSVCVCVYLSIKCVYIAKRTYCSKWPVVSFVVRSSYWDMAMCWEICSLLILHQSKYLFIFFHACVSVSRFLSKKKISSVSRSFSFNAFVCVEVNVFQERTIYTIANVILMVLFQYTRIKKRSSMHRKKNRFKRQKRKKPTIKFRQKKRKRWKLVAVKIKRMRACMIVYFFIQTFWWKTFGNRFLDRESEQKTTFNFIRVLFSGIESTDFRLFFAFRVAIKVGLLCVFRADSFSSQPQRRVTNACKAEHTKIIIAFFPPEPTSQLFCGQWLNGTNNFKVVDFRKLFIEWESTQKRTYIGVTKVSLRKYWKLMAQNSIRTKRNRNKSNKR